MFRNVMLNDVGGLQAVNYSNGNLVADATHDVSNSDVLPVACTNLNQFEVKMYM